MYNRYIPQPDGSYHRSRIPDPVSSAPFTAPKPESAVHKIPDAIPVQEHHFEKQNNPTYAPMPPRRYSRPHPQKPHAPNNKKENTSISSFLKQILPSDFDTADLLVVLLLLLMSGDCAEDQNTALLTLALYLFL